MAQRRKQSNPKPLKWDECVNDGEEQREASDKGDEGQGGKCAKMRADEKESEDLNQPDSSKSEGGGRENKSGDEGNSRHQEEELVKPTSEISADLNGSEPFSSARMLAPGVPYLHLLPHAMGTDAAKLFFMPTVLSSPDVPIAAGVPGVKGEKGVTEEGMRGGGGGGGPVFICEPCNIKFSSVRTLEAHQTYYCSFRKSTGENEGENSKPASDGKEKRSRELGASGTPSMKKRERSTLAEDLDKDVDLLGVHKNVKSGKLYCCIYCSYSADKKVSLNRHMRMHSGPSTPLGSQVNLASNVLTEEPVLPTPSLPREDSSGKVVESENALERYCQDCDIQFSSIKTFRVHKQYYCSTRHVLKPQQLGAASVAVPLSSSSSCQKQELLTSERNLAIKSSSPIPPSETSPSSALPSSPQQFVVLPTNPVIIVPYGFIQGASPLQTNLLPSQNALVVLPNGSVQCLPSTPSPVPYPTPSPQSMARLVLGSLHASTSNNTGITSLSPVFNDPKDILRKIWATPAGTIPNSRHSSDESSSEPHLNSKDFSLRSASSEADLNFTSVDSTNFTLRAEERLSSEDGHPFKFRAEDKCSEAGTGGSRLRASSCVAESILQGKEESPAIDLRIKSEGDDEKENRGLDEREECERLSVCSNAESEKRTARHSSTSISSSCSSPPEPKRNGFLNRVSPVPSKKRASTPKGLDFSVLEMQRSLPTDKASPIATQLPGGAILTRATNQSLTELLLTNSGDIETLSMSPQLLLNARAGNVNPALLGALTSDFAFRFLDPSYLATLQQNHKATSQTSQSGSSCIKRGVSKCLECDIVFYKYENYLVHKEHYCAARLNPPKLDSNWNSKEKDATSSSCSSPKSEIGEPASPPKPCKRRASSRSSLSFQFPKEDSCTDEKMSAKNSASVLSPKASAEEKRTLQMEKERSSTQFPCSKCGIIFSSLDTLQTHQTYYCRARGVDELDEPAKGEDKGFLRCAKCKLAVPEEHMALHSQICSGAKHSGSVSTAMGWKCPCCDTFSPTMSAAQKHLETHTGIRAFKCLLCGYRGNTLRGMRTHIRMHFDKRAADLQEGEYIACITSNTEGPSQQQPPPSSMNPMSASNTTAVRTGSADAGGNPACEVQQPASPAPSECEKYTNKASPADDNHIKVENNNKLHFCGLCNYSSSYKGNVVRHMKLVHKMSDDLTDDDLSCGQDNSNDSVPGDFHSLSRDSSIIRRGQEGEEGGQESKDGAEKCSSPKAGEREDNVQYCKSCKIYFNYPSTLMAHKKFYCSSHCLKDSVEKTETPVQ